MFVDVAKFDVFLGSTVETYIVLKDGTNAMTELGKVVFFDIHSVDKYGSLVSVVKSKQKFQKGGFAKTILAFNLGHLTSLGGEVEMAQHVALHFGIAEGNVAKFNRIDSLWERLGILGRDDGGLEVEEFEQIANEETVVVKTRNGRDQTGEGGLTTAEGLEEHDKCAHGDGSAGCTDDEEERDKE